MDIEQKHPECSIEDYREIVMNDLETVHEEDTISTLTSIDSEESEEEDVMRPSYYFYEKDPTFRDMEMATQELRWDHQFYVSTNFIDENGDEAELNKQIIVNGEQIEFSANIEIYVSPDWSVTRLVYEKKDGNNEDIVAIDFQFIVSQANKEKAKEFIKEAKDDILKLYTLLYGLNANRMDLSFEENMNNIKLRNCDLMHHQLNTINFCLKKEEILRSLPNPSMKDYTTLITDEVGSGKSYMIMGLCQPYPVIDRDDDPNFINTNLILCDGSIFHQWSRYLKEHYVGNFCAIKDDNDMDYFKIPFEKDEELPETPASEIVINQFKLTHQSQFTKKGEIQFDVELAERIVNNYGSLDIDKLREFNVFLVPLEFYTNFSAYFYKDNISINRFFIDEVDNLNLEEYDYQINANKYYFVSSSLNNLLISDGKKFQLLMNNDDSSQNVDIFSIKGFQDVEKPPNGEFQYEEYQKKNAFPRRMIDHIMFQRDVVMSQLLREKHEIEMVERINKGETYEEIRKIEKERDDRHNKDGMTTLEYKHDKRTKTGKWVPRYDTKIDMPMLVEFNRRMTEYMTDFVVQNYNENIEISFQLNDYLEYTLKCSLPAILEYLQNTVGVDIIDMINQGDNQGAIQKLGIREFTSEGIIDHITSTYKEQLAKCDFQLQSLQNSEMNIVDRMMCINMGFSPEQINTLFEQSNREEQIQTIMERKKSINQTIQNIITRTTENPICPISLDDIKIMTITPCCNNSADFDSLATCLVSTPNCPICRAPLDPSSLVVVNENIEMDVDKTDYTQISVENFIKSCHNKKKDENLKSLIQYIKQTTDKPKIIFGCKINQNSSDDSETFSKVSHILSNEGFDVSTVYGDVDEIDDIIQKYKTTDTLNAILLNANNMISGMNLENTTHIILYHKMDQDTIRQIYGRAQRPGRTSTLNIFKLFNSTENCLFTQKEFQEVIEESS